MTEPTPESIYDFARERGYMRETESSEPTPEQRQKVEPDEVEIVQSAMTGEWYVIASRRADGSARLKYRITQQICEAEARGTKRERERLANVWERALERLPKALAALIEEEEKKR